jgi:predicted GNAT family acetyltransferase
VTVTVRDNPDRHRYEVHDGEALAGYAEYERTEDCLTLTHTVVLDDFEGRGLAGQLARAALGEARQSGRSVLPRCEYMASYIARHREWLDLVPEDQRASFDLDHTA